MFIDILLTFFARAFKALANVFVIALVARILGRDELGLYFLSFGLSNPLSFLMPFGVGASVIRFVAGHGGDKKGAANVICTANVGVLLFSLLVFVFVYSFVQVFGGVSLSRFDLLLTLTIAVLMGVLNLQGDCFRSLGEYKDSSFYSGSLPSAVVLIVFIFLWILDIRLDLSDVLAITCLGYFFAVCASSSVLLKRLDLGVSAVFACVEYGKIFRYFKAGAGSLAGASVGVFLPSIALLTCGILYSNSEVAEFGLAQRVLFFVTLPLWIASTVLPARASRLLQENKIDALRSLAAVFSAGIGLVSLLVAIAVSLFGSELLGAIGGGDFPLAAKIFKVLAWMSALYSVYGVSISIVMVSRYSSDLIWSLVFALIAFAVVLFALKATLGVVGLAIAQAAAMLANALYAWTVLRRRLGVAIQPDLKSLAVKVLRKREKL